MHSLEPQLFALGLALASGSVEPPKASLESITQPELQAHLVELASGPMEGRDTPSLGLTEAASYIQGVLEKSGFRGAMKDNGYRHTYTRRMLAPVRERCALELRVDKSEPKSFALDADFVPFPRQDGAAEGALVFLGFGIQSKKEPYDDLKGNLKGVIALIVEGEPRHRTLFDGPEITPEADLYSKLVNLEKEFVAGVVVVRRGVEDDGAGKAARPKLKGIGFRHTFAMFLGDAPREPLRTELPVVEVTEAAATELLGEDPVALAEKIDKSGKPLRKEVKGRRVRLAAGSEEQELSIDNVVAVLPGTDAKLASEYVVLGAHYDHIGVDARGRVGFGADDNASGSSAFLEVVQALGKEPPRRSILACAFSGEEKGLLGSMALAKSPPVPKEQLVAMLNLDMIGRGKVDEVIALGTRQNPGFEKLLERARTKSTGVKTIVTGQGDELWQRSDHFSFHEIGVPVLFLFEGLPIDANKDYHTWRDTLDKLNLDKIARTAKLSFNVVWLLANEDERPPAPKK